MAIQKEALLHGLLRGLISVGPIVTADRPTPTRRPSCGAFDRSAICAPGGGQVSECQNVGGGAELAGPAEIGAQCAEQYRRYAPARGFAEHFALTPVWYMDTQPGGRGVRGWLMENYCARVAWAC